MQHLPSSVVAVGIGMALAALVGCSSPAESGDGGMPDAGTPKWCSEDGWCLQVPPVQTNALRAIWGTSYWDVWAVGAAGTILHQNGTGWQTATSGTTQDLAGVWASDSDDVWAVGEFGVILHRGR